MAKKKKNKFQIEFIDKFTALVTAAFGLVAALAWNDTMKLIFQNFFDTTNNVTPMIIYAFSVTLIAVLATIWVANISKKIKNP